MLIRSGSISLKSDVKDLLNRSFSFSSKRSTGGANHPSLSRNDERNIFCADLVTAYFIIDKLKEVKDKTEVVKLEIEDLLLSSHHSVLPIIKALVVSGKREWEWIRFRDSVEYDHFDLWHQTCKTIMKDYEADIDDASKFENIVSFEASIRIEAGTPSYVFRNIIQSLQKDQYLSKVTMEWVELGVVKKLVPSHLKQIVDPVSGEMTEEISLAVVSSWSEAGSCDYHKVLNFYIRELQTSGEATHAEPDTRPPRTSNEMSTSRRRPMRTKSTDGSSGPSLRRISTSKPSMRRTKSTDGSNFRRVKTDGSMLSRTDPDPMLPQKNAQWNATTDRRRPMRTKSIDGSSMETDRRRPLRTKSIDGSSMETDRRRPLRTKSTDGSSGPSLRRSSTSKPSMRQAKSTDGSPSSLSNVRRVRTEGSMLSQTVPDSMLPQKNAQWDTTTDRCRPLRAKSIDGSSFGSFSRSMRSATSNQRTRRPRRNSAVANRSLSPPDKVRSKKSSKSPERRAGGCGPTPDYDWSSGVYNANPVSKAA